MEPHPVSIFVVFPCGLEMLTFSSCNPKFFAVKHIHYPVNPSRDNFHTDAVVPSSDRCRTETVLPPSELCCTDTVAPSCDHNGTAKVAPPSDHLHTKVT